MLNNDTLSIMQECASIDTGNYKHILEQDNESDIINFFTEATEMNIDFSYRAEDVPVMYAETATGVENYIEYDTAFKLAEFEECTIKESMIKICEANTDMSMSNTYLVFDEKTSVIDSLKTKGKEEKAKIKKTIDDIKDKGIKIATKKKKVKKK